MARTIENVTNPTEAFAIRNAFSRAVAVLVDTLAKRQVTRDPATRGEVAEAIDRVFSCLTSEVDILTEDDRDELLIRWEEHVGRR
ncbi:MAG: hypothetical protein Q8R28_08020 [Dehalococcoidia bacterium]|nr:hypothetical protein [Dehalococcoidia bacterium]